MKFSKNFDRDWDWYVKYKDIFTFDGTADTASKVIYSPRYGRPAKECFLLYDSQGKVSSTTEPELLYFVFKCKGSINFNIKMWAESRGKAEMGKLEFMETIVPEYELLDWMIEAVENQRMKYWKLDR